MFEVFRKYRYRDKKKERQQVMDYITGHMGPVERVIPSFTNRDLPVDIAVIPPSEDRAYYTLVTVGMGAYKIASPKAPSKRLELAIRLPADWELDSDREALFWPVRWLQILARLPMYQHTWFTHGHTVDTNRYLVGDGGFHGFALHNFSKSQNGLPLIKGDRLSILALLPVYKEELEAARLGCTEDVFARLGEETCFAPVATDRKNVCL